MYKRDVKEASLINFNHKKHQFLIFSQDPSNTQQHFAVSGFSPQYIYFHSSTMPAKEKIKQQLTELNYNDSLEKSLTSTCIPCIIYTLRTIQQILSSI